MKTMNILARLAVIATLIAGLCNVAFGQTIISQTPGTDYLAFEAEDVSEIINGDDSTGWVIVDTESPLQTDFGTKVLPEDTPANRGMAIFDINGGSNTTDVVGYKLQFAEPGDYHLYFRYSLFERGDNPASYGNENSIYVSSVFGTDGIESGSEADPRGGIENPSMYLSIPNGGKSATNGDFEGSTYEWWNITPNGDDTDAQASNPEGIYTPPDVNTTLDFGIAARERHVSIDRFVFHKDGDLAPEDLDALLSFAPGTGTPGDYNEDDIVNLADFILMAANFGDRFAIADSFGKGDENRDGLVDITDFVLFRRIFNEANPVAASVPEPTSVGIALIGLLILPMTRRRR